MDRRKLEEREFDTLSEWAVKSRESEGRRFKEEPCDYRTIFQRDRDRIIHSKAFRRLKHKTQVFISPGGDHYRTRLTHTLEVAQISRTIARCLKLNEDLTEAIALGHDLGHTPFGHAGEDLLHNLCENGFCHNRQSLRVVDHLENRGEKQGGLNLTYEVRNGILTHTGEQEPATLEGMIVRIADRIAYINHDIDDALRAGIIKIEELPDESLNILGRSHSRRIDTMVRDIIENSCGREKINRSSEVKEATRALRTFLFRHVYIGSEAKKEEIKAQRLLKMLFEYYVSYPEEIPGDFRKGLEADKEQLVVDYIAGMSDRYAINKGRSIFIPRPWLKEEGEDFLQEFWID
ncbi:MAG: deoxyguanosinetriphosphate triphosphohydrolase [Halanaerobiaceae bacterium]